MMSVTSQRARAAGVTVAALLLLSGVAGCDSGDDLGAPEGPATSGHGKDGTPVTTTTTLHAVGNRLNASHRARIKEGVNDVVDPWFDSAFLGDFPRSDWSAAFTGFTKGAASDAQGRDLDLLTNAGISDRIRSATATRRRVRLNVFAYKGHPRGATAHFILDFTTTGDLAQSMELRGDLYLAKDKGEWKIFGYDVDQAVSA